jgi:hypothetical protein
VAKRRVNNYPEASRKMALERLKNCASVTALATEPGVHRTVLYPSFAKTIIGLEMVDFPTRSRHNLRIMLAVILHCFRLLFLLISGHQAIAFANIALRQQLAIFKRANKRPRLTGRDRWFDYHYHSVLIDLCDEPLSNE